MISRPEALAALRRVLEAVPIADGASVLDVVEAPDADALHVLVTWRSRLRRYRPHVPADDAALATDLNAELTFAEIGCPLSPEEWAASVRLWLQEGLDTGMLAWARRTELPDRTVVIDRTASAPPAMVGGDIGEVPLSHGRPGRHLEAAGLDPLVGRDRWSSGSLIGWLQLWSDDTTHARVVGQAVIARDHAAADVAVVDLLELQPDVPEVDAEHLVWAAVAAAADTGARWVDARVDPRA